jgi:ribonuclease-3 family protein
MDENKLKTVSTAALAYLGDSIIELCVRETLVKKGVSSAKNLNFTALLFVKAEAQADAIMKILPILTDEENAAYRRGRNIGHTNVPKSATVGQYRMATGFEALFGYLWLTDKKDRINELFMLAYEDKINEIDMT